MGVPVVSIAEMGTRDVLRKGCGVWLAEEEPEDFKVFFTIWQFNHLPLAAVNDSFPDVLLCKLSPYFEYLLFQVPHDSFHQIPSDGPC